MPPGEFLALPAPERLFLEVALREALNNDDRAVPGLMQ